MRWYSLNGVPRGSKNGSGAIIRIFISGESLELYETWFRQVNVSLAICAS